MPKVSVIISSYNHAPYIGQAIESVLAQDFQDFEIIVTDDASTDNTLEVLAQFDDPRLKVFSFTENRKEHMKNEALARASGEYVAILNSDDEMLPQRLTEQVNYLDQHPDVLAVFSPHHHVDEHGNILRTTSADNKPRHAWLRFFIDKGNRFGHSTAMIRRSFFQQHGPYNRWLILCSDIDLWVRICFRGDIHMLDKPLTAIRQLPNEQNLSGRTPATDNRGALEFPLVLNHYFEEENPR